MHWIIFFKIFNKLNKNPRLILTCLQPLTLSVSIRPRLPDSCAMFVSLSFHNCPTFRVVKPLQWFASAVAVFDVKLKHPNNSTSRKLNRNNLHSKLNSFNSNECETLLKIHWKKVPLLFPLYDVLYKCLIHDTLGGFFNYIKY